MLELVSCLRTAVNVYNSETLNEAASFALMFEGERQEQRCSIVDADQAVVWSSIRKEMKPTPCVSCLEFSCVSLCAFRRLSRRALPGGTGYTL